MPAPSPAKMESTADGANGVFTVFDNQLFAPNIACQQHSVAMRAPEPSAQGAEQVGQVSAAAQQPSCSCGMGDDSMRDLQRALQHRHSMLKTYKHLTEGLWEQLQQVLGTCSQAVHQATTNLQLLLDIDQTLVSSTFLSDAFDASSGTRKFEDPDLQKFHNLAEQFWKWTDDALDAHDHGKPWPTWMPTAEVEGRTYTMWLPEPNPAFPRPMPEFIAPMWDADGTLTHYFCMYGSWSESGATTAGGKPTLTCMQSMSVIPAEITMLAYIRYELAAGLDCRRRQHGTPNWQGAACTSSAGRTEVELRLASCGSRGYVAKIADILQQVLSCEHGGRVFVEHNAFKNDGTFASCKGVKSLAPFTGLRHTGPGCICPRLVLDDCLEMWGLDPAKDAVRLMPTTSWKGRWPQPSSDVCASADSDDEQDAALAALAAQNAAEAAAAAAAATTTGDSTAEAMQQQQPVITHISSPRPTAAMLPVPPQGLTVLLPEVLKLVAKELVEVEAKLPPIMPPSLPAHLLPKALAALQRTDSAASDNSTCPNNSTCATSSVCAVSASAGSLLRGSPRAEMVAVRRKGISPRLGLGLGRQSPGGKRRRSNSSDDQGGGSSLAGLGAAFDAAA